MSYDQEEALDGEVILPQPCQGAAVCGDPQMGKPKVARG